MADAQLIWGLALFILVGTFGAAYLTAGRTDHRPATEPLDLTGAVRRRIGAKRVNEHLKLLATFFNNLGVAVIVTALLAPFIQSGGALAEFQTSVALMVAGVLHISGQMVLRLLKSEE